MATSIGATWILVGLVTWSLLNWQAQYWLHTPSALEQIRAQVPMQMYDRSTFLFFTALVMDVLNILFERQTTKLDYVLLPAFVKGMATTSNLVVRFGTPSVAFSTYGRPFMVQRYVCWAHTTPTLLMLVRLISSSISHSQFLTVLAWDETMLLTGVLALITTGWLQVLFIIITHAALLPIIPYLHKGFYEAIQEVTSQNTRRLMWAIFGLNVLLWATFGITWDLAFLDFISLQQEETLYIICDFSAKVLFSSTLMLSSFKSMEGRREATMRHIEEGSKQKLIEELRHLLEQKERFMSSVSHELRTPLNGIIGISEGMLSGCCGALSEHTRRQVYIIRTSGARLLALINDVMDASALKQNKLVLKQEQIVLRHVVDDVLDLTRSLVDPEVELHNAIAPRVTVQGDTGRLVQILNNLLGNAAKFTRRGFIKVSARSIDSGAWVAITVQDTGIGVPQSKLAHIFLPFEQVDMSISRKYGGFGLGLNIVQELVKAHGGEIWVESTEGKGSTFTFTMMSGQPKTSLDGERSPSEACMTLAERTDWPSTQQLGQRQMPWASKSTGNLEHKAAPHSLLQAGRQQGGGSATDLVLEAVEEGKGGKPAQGRLGVPSGRPAAGHSAAEQAAPDPSKRCAAPPPQPQPDPPPHHRRVVGSNRQLYHTVNDSYQIMSVDDDAVNQSVVQSLLCSTGYEVISFPGGPEALAHIASCGVLPDLILLDCMMPGMDGYEVLQRLRSMLPKTHIPVIMVSARAEEENIVRGLETGADDYVTKPFRRAEFLARVRGQLGVTEQEDLEYETAEAAVRLRRMGGGSRSHSGALELPSSSRQPGSRAATLTPAAAPKHSYVILAIDDDEVNQVILEGMLRSQNMRYLKAKSGEEGLSQLVANPLHPPDLLVLDASLPDMSGFEVCKRIRCLYSKLEVPIIMLSARHNEQAVVEGLLCGANDYVTKPFKRNELMARIRMHLRMLGSSGGSSPLSPSTSASMSRVPDTLLPAPSPLTAAASPSGRPGRLLPNKYPPLPGTSSPPTAGAAAILAQLPSYPTTKAPDSRLDADSNRHYTALLPAALRSPDSQLSPSNERARDAEPQHPDKALLSGNRTFATRSHSPAGISTACTRALAGFSYAPAPLPRAISPGESRQSVSLNSHVQARRIAGLDSPGESESHPVPRHSRASWGLHRSDLATADGVDSESSLPSPHPDLGNFSVAATGTNAASQRRVSTLQNPSKDTSGATASQTTLSPATQALNRAASVQSSTVVLPTMPCADFPSAPRLTALTTSAGLLPWSKPAAEPGLAAPPLPPDTPDAALAPHLARQATSAVSSNQSMATITFSLVAPHLHGIKAVAGPTSAHPAPPPAHQGPGLASAAAAVGGGGGGPVEGVGKWGVLVARVSDYPSLCRQVPNEELLAAVQKLVQLFTRSTASLGLSLLHCDGEVFTAATTSPLAAGHGAVVALLQLAQALLDSAGVLLLPTTQQPLRLQLLLHVAAESAPSPDPLPAQPPIHPTAQPTHQPPARPGDVMDEIVAEAQAWLLSAPLLAITASPAAAGVLVGAGMAPPQQVMWVGLPLRPLSILEVHPNASLLTPSPSLSSLTSPAVPPAPPGDLNTHHTNPASAPGPGWDEGGEAATPGDQIPAGAALAQRQQQPSPRPPPKPSGKELEGSPAASGWPLPQEGRCQELVDNGTKAGGSSAGAHQLASMQKELNAMRLQLQQLAMQGRRQIPAGEPAASIDSPVPGTSRGLGSEAATSAQRVTDVTPTKGGGFSRLMASLKHRKKAASPRQP